MIAAQQAKADCAPCFRTLPPAMAIKPASRENDAHSPIERLSAILIERRPEEADAVLTIVLGAILVVAGLLYQFREALGRRRLSEPHRPDQAGSKPTLEPRRQGVGFLSIRRNWPGLAMMIAGAILLIFGAYA
ncbi:hypothetical protein SAMN02982989_2707 [Xaviernesmea oryzae]|uniref:Uncharacterized protein n=1 Tax=Xaviernesmea oryzae TaxID=464029 RepID=A0A1X7FD74_9HYPH|nr:hypothetical protein SAMN02982989_2707 [Xaviernesmea oryzae]